MATERGAICEPRHSFVLRQALAFVLPGAFTIELRRRQDLASCLRFNGVWQWHTVLLWRAVG